MNFEHRIAGASLAVAALATASLLGCSAGDSSEPGEEGILLESVTTEMTFEAEGNRGVGEKACGIDRADHLTANRDIVWLQWGNYGVWESCVSWCPAGSYAYGAQLVSESSQGAGDDTAVNSIRLNCYDRWTGNYTGTVASAAMPWGQPGSTVVSSLVSDPIVGGKVKFQQPAGAGIDDAQITAAMFRLRSQSWITPSPSNVVWGSWLSEDNQCQAGSAVCGIKTMYEPQQGSGDDTALTGGVLYCCSFPT